MSTVSSLLHLVRGCVRVDIIVDILSHLPHLQDVVLRDTAHYPRVIGVPSEVGDLGSVPTMDELCVCVCVYAWSKSK